jgi:hypothetical protein
MVLPHGNPFLHKQLMTGPPLEPVEATTTAPEPPVPSSCPDTGLSEGQVMELALALHERWHGTHLETSETYTLACADRAGAFTDAETVAPVLAGWIRDAFVKAAHEVERYHDIGHTPRADVEPEDWEWFKDQTAIRDVVSDHDFLTRKRTLALADWLYTLAGGRPA